VSVFFLAMVVAALVIGYLIGWRDVSRFERRRMLLNMRRSEVSE
jgi:hypothetical protein